MAILVAHISVPHNGWLKLFHHAREKYNIRDLWILGNELIQEFTYKYQDIWALPPESVKIAVESWKIFSRVRIIERNDLIGLDGGIVILANDTISHKLVNKYLQDSDTIFLPIFLRYDENNVFSQEPAGYDIESNDPFDIKMIQLAHEEGSKTSDFWRQVGGIIVKDRKFVLNGHNTHLPNEHINHIIGDPRNFVKAGQNAELTSSIHAEQAIIAEAARQGISLEGADLYLSVFPCPVCAKLMAGAGIKRCFYSTGAAYLDAERVLHAFGIELIYVKRPRCD